ncbi:ribonuclease H-like domain-containing protein [Tanacetum coccineum]
MDLETAQTTTTAKLPILIHGEYEIWRLRIEQYFQVQDYALWDAIENGNSFKPVPQTTTNVDGSSTSLIPDFCGNEATKKTQKTLLKQMYENFSALSTESLDSIFNRLQNINMAFVSSPSNINEVNTVYGVSTANTQVSPASTQVSIASTQVSTANLSDDSKTGRKITINGSDTVGYDNSKVECFNCHKMGHFARECRGPRNQDSRNRNQDTSKRTINVEETSSKAMVAIDGAGFDWSYMTDDEVPTNMALMAFSDSEVHNDKTCSTTCLKRFETLKTQLDDLRVEFNKSEFNLATYKRGLASVEEQLLFTKKMSELEKLKQEKESNQLKIENFDNASKSLDKLIGSLIPNKSRKGVGFVSYNVVPSPPTRLFLPPKFDLSNSGLEEFQQSEFEGYGPKTSKSVSEDISNEVRESPDAPLIEELVSDDKLKKKTIFPAVAKIEFGTCPIFKTLRNLMEDMLPLGGGAKGGKITGKGTLKTDKLDFEDVYFVKELQFNLFSVSQMCEKKNSVLFINTGCFVLSPNFKLADETDSKLPTTFWVKAVNTAIQNRVLVVKPHNKTPYELFRGRTHALSFMRPFGCHVTILNTLDYLGKFYGKSDEGFFVGYSMNSKAFRVYNIRTRKVEENLHIRFLEDKPIIAGDGPKWLFDIDVLTKSMNYEPVVAGTNFNDLVGTEESIGACYSSKETGSSQDYILMPLWKDGSLFDSSLKNASNDEPQPSSDSGKKDDECVNKESIIDDQERPKNSTQYINTARPSINTTITNINIGSLNINNVSPTVTTAPLEATHANFFGDET